MTVQIIKAGNIPEPKTYATNCRNCNTIFSFAKIDAQVFMRQRDYGGSSKAVVSITCPLCGEAVSAEVEI